MAGAGFSFTFYVRDWLTGTRLLTFEERGLYIDLLALIYERRGKFAMPSEADFCRMLGCDPRVLRRVLGRLVILGKIEVKNGVISNGKADDQFGHPPDFRGTSAELPRNFLETSSKSSAEVALESEQYQEPASVPSSSLSSSDKKEPNGSLSTLAISKASWGTRISADWHPSPDEEAFAVKAGMTTARAQETAARFRDYWIAKAGQGGVKLDWTATWRNWVRNEIARNGASKPNGHDDGDPNAPVNSPAWRKAHGLHPIGGGEWPKT